MKKFNTIVWAVVVLVVVLFVPVRFELSIKDKKGHPIDTPSIPQKDTIK